MHLALLYILAATKHTAGRAIAIIDAAGKPPLVLCTDAAQDSCRTRIGAKLIAPGDKVRITVYGVPDHLVQSWGDVGTSINQAELFANLV